MNESIDKETGASAEAIEHHYGTGNDYFALWLDRSMTYSCALWNADDSEQTLDDAQTRKLDYHIEQAHAQGAGRVYSTIPGISLT